ELDTTATFATPIDTPELQDPPNENLNMDTSAAQDGVLDENSVDLQQLENENPDEGLDATKDDVPDQDSMELQQTENGIKEQIWSDYRCQACASKKIEVLEQKNRKFAEVYPPVAETKCKVRGAARCSHVKLSHPDYSSHSKGLHVLHWIAEC
ncbi:hypothetical protein MRX96_050530, partial [Rhipicephalus microplus]